MDDKAEGFTVDLVRYFAHHNIKYQKVVARGNKFDKPQEKMGVICSAVHIYCQRYPWWSVLKNLPRWVSLHQFGGSLHNGYTVVVDFCCTHTLIYDLAHGPPCTSCSCWCSHCIHGILYHEVEECCTSIPR